MADFYLPRDIEPVLKKLCAQFNAIALTGPRQSGKSTLLKNIFSDYTYITFDDPLNRERALRDPNLFLEEAKDKVIFDEIQYAPELLHYIKMHIDKERNKRGRFIIHEKRNIPHYIKINQMRMNYLLILVFGDHILN